MSKFKNLDHHKCPACGYQLSFSPWEGNSPSDGICHCCGIHFGYDDLLSNNENERKLVYENWRNQWIAGGYKWFSRTLPPEGWNGEEQLSQFLKQDK
jgi:hypothetical protein